MAASGRANPPFWAIAPADHVHRYNPGVAKSSGASRNTDAYVQAVERALDLCINVDELGAQSPLAAPYFLGDAMRGQSDTAAGRGTALRGLLRTAATELSTDHKRLIDATFLERDPRLNNVGVFRSLSMSEATYYRHRANAIATLAHTLNRQTVPPVRSERPRARAIIDRVAQYERCMSALQNRHSIALTGISGVGKTALAAKIADTWAPNEAFWFTVRPGLNDQLSSLVFALAHFLRDAGASSLWRQLVADRGRLNLAQTMGMLRHDLSQLPQPALLCIDESDQLRMESRDGAQILHMLDEVRELAPVVFIGQHPVIETHETFTLLGLTSDDIAEWFSREGVAVSSDDCARVRRATRGNPALIRLLIALQRDGVALNNALTALAAGPSTAILLNQLWHRLSETPRKLLCSLSVFDGASPIDAWANQPAALDGLLAYGLALDDGRGGISVPEIARSFALQRVSAETLALLHLDAAIVRESRGEFTAAARHYLEAGQPSLAIWTWYNRSELETERGHAPVARELFRRLRADELPDADDARALALLRAEQFLLTGAADEAVTELNAATWPRAHTASARAAELLGDAFQQQGMSEQALAQYREAFKLASDSQLRQIERVHTKAGYTYLYRLRDLDLAQREAGMALCQAHNFAGLAAEEAGEYAAAHAHYEAALTAADSMPNRDAVRAITHSHLGHLFMRQGDAEAAIRNLEISLRQARRAGESLNAVYDQMNLANACNVAGRHAEALIQASEALEIARMMSNSFLIAAVSAAAAEAHFGLNQLDEAERLAQLSIREEDEVHRAYGLTVIGQVQGRRGQIDAAQRTLDAAIASARESRDRYAEAYAWRALSEVPGAHAADARAQALALFDSLGLTRQAAALRG